MFSVHDPRGRCIAFSGRRMGEDGAKYINSPETPVFRKSDVLYNFHRARKHVSSSAQDIIVVEGQTDVISMCESGFCGTVSSLGTALTAKQMSMLWSVSNSPIVCLDGDDAGLRASFKALDRALPLITPSKVLRFAILPSGEDPDSFILKNDELALMDVFRNFLSLCDMIWLKNSHLKDMSTPEARADFRDKIYEDTNLIKSFNLKYEIRKELLSRFNERFSGKKVAWKRDKKEGPSDELMKIIYAQKTY